MNDDLLRISTTGSYDDTVELVRNELGEAGFGVLTEIDLRSTLKEKLDVDVAPQVILGACRPQLAHQALEADPSVASLLPCNVVVRDEGEGGTVVEAYDPVALMGLTGQEDESVRSIAEDARERLRGALAAVKASPSG